MPRQHGHLARLDLEHADGIGAADLPRDGGIVLGTAARSAWLA
jgi:hypothetical protein